MVYYKVPNVLLEISSRKIYDNRQRYTRQFFLIQSNLNRSFFFQNNVLHRTF